MNRCGDAFASGMRMPKGKAACPGGSRPLRVVPAASAGMVRGTGDHSASQSVVVGMISLNLIQSASGRAIRRLFLYTMSMDRMVLP